MKKQLVKLNFTAVFLLTLSTSASYNVTFAATKDQVAATKSADENISVMTPQQTQQLADNVLRETAILRGLAIRKKVPCKVQSQTEVQSMLQDTMKKGATSNQMQAANFYLQQLRLAPKNFNLPEYYLKMLDEQLAGYYDPQTDKFYTTSRVDRLQLQTVMSHELTHALQDQHFDLSRLQKCPDHESDSRSAMQALVEGDATLAMMQYTARNPFRSLAMLASSLMAGSSSQTFLGAPQVLQDSMTFPYVKGMAFASALHKIGGWRMVNAAYMRLPASTEQIMHIEKYLADDKPINVPVRDLIRFLGPEWTLLDQDVNGESGLYSILKEHIAEYEAATAAEGWAGDRCAIYHARNGAGLITQVALWDSENDASEFTQAYVHNAIARTKTQAKVIGNSLLWKFGQDSIFLQRRGKKVVVLEAHATAVNLPSLAKLL